MSNATEHMMSGMAVINTKTDANGNIVMDMNLPTVMDINSPTADGDIQNITDPVEAAKAKIAKDKENNEDMYAQVILTYVESLCNDVETAKLIIQPHKSWRRCWLYILKESLKIAKKGEGSLNGCSNWSATSTTEEAVFGWVRDYLHADDAEEIRKEEEAKKAREERAKKATEASKKATKPKTGKKSETSKKAVKKDTVKNADQSDSVQQMSLFDTPAPVADEPTQLSLFDM